MTGAKSWRCAWSCAGRASFAERHALKSIKELAWPLSALFRCHGALSSSPQNVASRMETASRPGHIRLSNVSGRSAADFHCRNAASLRCHVPGWEHDGRRQRQMTALAPSTLH